MICQSGPLWTYWAFVMEQICGQIVHVVNSRLHLCGTLQQRMKRIAQLQQILNIHELRNAPELAFLRDASHIRDDSKLSHFETMIPGCESIDAAAYRG